MSISLSHPTQIVKGEIQLTSSKSESNRALIIKALCNDAFMINNLSNSDDTVILKNILEKTNQPTMSVGLAGTAMRFLTAFLSIRKGEIILTGDQRMKERPIKVLVDALTQLGADIDYIEKDGYPPLKIAGKALKGGKVVIDGSVSSQYISALLMIAPQLDNGIEIEFTGEIISKPYINMTVDMMSYFEASVQWEENAIIVKPSDYKAKAISIETDWSAASYWYGMVALAKEADLTIYGLKKDSLQGDSAVVDIYKNFGVDTEFIEGGIRLTKNSAFRVQNSALEIDCVNFPDITQTIAVSCAALNVKARLSGLKTLRIKETDRITALQNELNKLGFRIEVEDNDLIINQTNNEVISTSSIKTYNDHRMAMAFAPLGLLNTITIENPEVVKKSYPNFWDDMKKIGFTIY